MAVKVNTYRQAKRFQAMRLFSGLGKTRNGQILINVTALVDMMTVLVIFLIMQFSTTGEMLFISKNLQMPTAEHGSEVTHVPILSIDRMGALYVDGAIIEAHLTPPKQGEDWEIATLAAKLKTSLDKNPSKIVNVQVDQNVDYGILKKVLRTCETSGYGKIRLAVGRESKATIK